MTAPKNLPEKDETLGGGAADLEAARRVFRLESDGIAALADALDDNFLAAVGMLSRVTGRVSVTGMGRADISRVRSPRPSLRPVHPHIMSIRVKPATAILA